MLVLFRFLDWCKIEVGIMIELSMRRDSMLKLYDAELRNKLEKEGKTAESLPLPVIDDVEEAFGTISLVDDEITRKILKYVEKGDFLSNTHYRDRFGCKLSLFDMSTGCKAALLVHYRQDAIIDTKECGLNARDAIIRYCINGNALFYEKGVSINMNDINDVENVSIMYRGIFYRNIAEFNDAVS